MRLCLDYIRARTSKLCSLFASYYPYEFAALYVPAAVMAYVRIASVGMPLRNKQYFIRLGQLQIDAQALTDENCIAMLLIG
jgi:hypothetical protein